MWNSSPMIRPPLTSTAPPMGFGWASATPRRARSNARSIHLSSAVRATSRALEETDPAASGVKTPDDDANFLSELKLRPPEIRLGYLLVEEGVDIGLGVEGDEVVDFFAGSDEADGEIQFAGDGYDDAAFGGAVELCQDNAGDAGVAPEFAGLVEAVLSGGGVENQENIVRRAGNNFCGGAFHFVQLGH